MSLSNDTLRNLTLLVELKADGGMLQRHFDQLKAHVIKGGRCTVDSLEGFRLALQLKRVGGISQEEHAHDVDCKVADILRNNSSCVEGAGASAAPSVPSLHGSALSSQENPPAASSESAACSQPVNRGVGERKRAASDALGGNIVNSRAISIGRPEYVAARVDNPLVVSADVVRHLADFVHKYQYLFFAPVSTTWKEAWGQRPETTRAVGTDTMVPQLLESLGSGLKSQGKVCDRAAAFGRLDLLQCARAYGCPWTDSVYSGAAEGGHVHIMAWALSYGCPLKQGACDMAARAGHLRAVQWAHAHGWHADEETCRQAALGGHLSIVQWLRSIRCPWDTETCFEFARGGHLKALQWARANGCPWDEDTCSGAAQEGHLDVLQWAHANRCPWDEDTCYHASVRGHLEVLQWAHGNGCPWDERTCRVAASLGNLKLLQWAHDNGCPWDEETCGGAAAEGHLGVLQWLRDNGCPWDQRTRTKAAARGHMDVVQWARANGCP